MQDDSLETDWTGFIQGGVPLSETLPEEVFLSIQAGRLKAVMMALDEMAKAVYGQYTYRRLHASPSNGPRGESPRQDRHSGS